LCANNLRMPSSIWSGSISFGLVSVPVKIFSAVQTRTVRFSQLHKADHARIEQKRVSSADGEEVVYADIVKGYEIAPGSHVVIEADELATLVTAGTRTIDIEDFVDLADIDPIYYDHAYYLAPGTGGEKPYHLLLDAMSACGKVAIARVVLRSKEHLVAIRPIGTVLGMATMAFADEIVPLQQIPGLTEEAPALSDRERDFAQQLVNSLATPFDPTKYHDTYRQAVLALIQRKAEGKEIAVAPATPPRATAPDLMSALQASLENVRSRNGGKTGTKPRKKAKATKSAPGTSAPTSRRKPIAAKPSKARR
jgi:DNA end-binding protein Ku